MPKFQETFLRDPKQSQSGCCVVALIIIILLTISTLGQTLATLYETDQ